MCLPVPPAIMPTCFAVLITGSDFLSGLTANDPAEKLVLWVTVCLSFWNECYNVFNSQIFLCFQNVQVQFIIFLATVDVSIALSWLAVDFKTTNLCLCKPAVHSVLWNLLCHQYEGSPSIETSSHPRETLGGHFCSISEMRGNKMFTLERT